eukprot:CAMPEP_0179039526 /NCGR_PEP_ID=MMETSP0796-20121207/15186_1 /TAXON_ID=73915 /ORGANISM="Pyrodinium bahamense, Strain pbaha01" /LENGTH=767 /DNA_ID=CAMNT_0020735861 /DNA_START=26 /DNA_END=2329 /DNA_ORIENTATION=-
MADMDATPGEGAAVGGPSVSLREALTAFPIPCEAGANAAMAVRPLLRRMRLRVAPGVAPGAEPAAGLELTACDLGYLVEQVDAFSGQPGLKPGDAIVAAGGWQLVGSVPEDVEKFFGAAFCDGAELLVGVQSLLVQWPVSDVSLEVQRVFAMALEFPSAPMANCQGMAGGSAVQERPGGATSGPLCHDDADDGVVVRKDGHGAECKRPGAVWSGARGRPGVRHGAYQFEVRLESACLLRVGWATSFSKRALGKDARSFGFGGTAMKSSGGKFEQYGEVFDGRNGAVVGCLVDRRDPHRQTISFSLDGRNLGEAFGVPDSLADVPLFPAICGRGEWQAACCWFDLAFPEVGYCPLAEALAAGDAVTGPQRAPEPPMGIPINEGRSAVQQGSRVVLQVLSGAWQGRHICEVLDVDAGGCYLRHEEDNFKEHLPWGFLNGTRYRMQVLPQEPAIAKIGPLEAPAEEVPCEQKCCRQQVEDLSSIILAIVQLLDARQLQAVDASLSDRQHALVAWLASRTEEEGALPCVEASVAGLAGSAALREWLGAVGLAGSAAEAVQAWCTSQGAASLQEVVEHREDLLAAIPELAVPQRRARLMAPAAAKAADLAIARSCAGELTALLMELAACLSDEQVDAADAGLSAKQRALVAWLAARGGEEGVVPTTASHVSRRDGHLLRVAACLGPAASLSRCEACRQPFRSGKSCEEDGNLYCEECWREWEDVETQPAAVKGVGDKPATRGHGRGGSWSGASTASSADDSETSQEEADEDR